MIEHLFLFCGGAAIDESSHPKPLMKIWETRSLIAHFLDHVQKTKPQLPKRITLLCDDGQEIAYRNELLTINYPVPVDVLACGAAATTYQKFQKALRTVKNNSEALQFGYPDIFFFGESAEPGKSLLNSESAICISVTALTSRFPRLIIDIYRNEVKGISNYSSPIPANPLHIFGGDIWGKASALQSLSNQFQEESRDPNPSLEYDFFFWLINNTKTRCIMLYGDWMEIDSIRDIRRLLARTKSLQQV